MQANNWEIYIGAIAIQRDGHTGRLMGSENGHPIVDGEKVHPDDVRLVPNKGDETRVAALAAELGHDAKAQAAIVEAVRLLREKVPAETANPTPNPSSAAVPPSPDPLPHSNGEGEKEADALGLPVNLEKLIDSLRAENTLLHREVDKLKARPDFADDFEALSKRVEQEKAMREKAQAAAIEAEKLMEAAQVDAAQVRLELMKEKNALTPNPSPDGRGERKPIEAKVIAQTTEADFERMWADDWEMMHCQVISNPPMRDAIYTVWRKVNDYTRPDGSPIREVVEVALPTIADKSPMETSGLTLQQADAVLFGSVNIKLGPQPAPENDIIFNTPSAMAAGRKLDEFWNEAINIVNRNNSAAENPLPASPASEGGAKEAAAVVIEPVVIEPVVIQPADVFPRFDGFLNGLPIAQAIARHGVEATKQAMDLVAARAAAEAVGRGNALANREFTQFSSQKRLEATGV